MKQNQSEQNHLKQIFFLLLLSAVLFGGCANKSNKTTADSNESLPEEKSIVETVVLQ